MEIVSINDRKKTSEKEAEGLAKDCRMIYSAFRAAGFSDDQAFTLLLDVLNNASID